ncbi:MAG: dihydroorotase family protein [Waddliaceae bacterium]
MITIKNLRTIQGDIEKEYVVESQESQVIDARERLTLFPALIDTHVHFPTDKKGDWESGAKAAITGGVTTVFQTSSSDSFEGLKSNLTSIDRFLKEISIPLRYRLYFPGSATHLGEMDKLTDEVVGLKVVLAPGVDDSFLEEVFRTASQKNLPIAIQLEEAQAIESIQNVLHQARSYPCPLYFLNIRTQDQLDIIQKAKHEEILVYTGVKASDLLADTSDVLWQAINEDIIDTVGCGDPDFITLPLLLNAAGENRISYEKVVALTKRGPQEIFNLQNQDDLVLVDLEKEKSIGSGLRLKGWPEYTIIQGKAFHVASADF